MMFQVRGGRLNITEDQIGVTILITGISNGDFLSRQEGGGAEVQEGAGRDQGLRPEQRSAEGPEPSRGLHQDVSRSGPGPRGPGRAEGGWDMTQALRGRSE